MQMTISEEEDFCILLYFAATSDALLLAETISDMTIAEDSSVLDENKEIISIPVVVYSLDKPPSV